MVADNSTLVMVMPGDDIDTVIGRIGAANASTIQLLIPDGATALQTGQDVRRLCAAAGEQGVTLLPICSDEQILDAFCLNGVAAIAVQHTRVRPDTTSEAGKPARRSYTTRRMASEEPIIQSPPAVEESDEDFLRQLNERAQEPASRTADHLRDAMDSMTPRSGSLQTDDDELAAQFDDFSDMIEREQQSSESYAARPLPPRPPRVRPEDIELSPEETARAAKTRTSTPTRPRVEQPVPRPEVQPIPPPHDGAPRRRSSERRSRRARRPGRPGWVPVVLISVLILLLFTAAIFLIFGNRVTVALSLPERATEIRSFDKQVIPLVPPGSEVSASAIQAGEVRSEAGFSVRGQAGTEVAEPVGTAGGSVLLRNLGTQAFAIPAGTEFIALNEQGQEVRFASDADVTVPPSTTSRQGAQIITSLGEATVNVTARSPGSAANVGANSIRQIAPPGQPPIAVNTGSALEVVHEPLTGGSEAMVRIVSAADVQQLLGEALTGLNNQGRQNLEQAAVSQGLVFEPMTVSPSPDQLVAGQGYEMIVNPPIGERVPDPDNPDFEIQVRGIFSALATPPDRPLQDQLQQVLPEQLRISNLIRPGDGQVPLITGWDWDGQRLTARGELRPTDSGAALDQATLDAIKSSIAGKSRAEAEAALENFVQQGVIGGYALPDVASLPGWDFQITLEVVPAPTP
jgi:hypothetical protein